MSKSKNREFNSLGDVYGNILNKVRTVSEGVNEIGDAPLQAGGPLEKSGFSTKVVDRRTLKDKGKGKELENFYNINRLSEEDEEEGCKHAAEGCDCNDCSQCKANQNKEEDEESLKESRKIARKSLNNFMRQKSVFDRLYANVMKESFGMPGGQSGNPYGDEAEEGNDLDALGLDEVTPDDELGGEGEGDEVSFTLDRATAEKLHEVLGAVLGGDMGEDDMGEDDMGEDDMGEEGGMEMGEEDEEELGHAGVNAKYNDGKSNKVGNLKVSSGGASSKYTDKVGDDGDHGHAIVNAKKYNDGKSNKVGSLKTGKSAFEQ